MHALLESILYSDKPITINQLAEKFEVSGKTIRNDLSSANTLLTNYGLTLIKKPGIGIHIQGEEIEKQKFLNYVKPKKATVFPTKERQNKLLIRLLSSDNPILIKELSQDYYVSRSTITKDLDKLNKRLLPYNLQIRNIKTYGLVIEGNEKEKRKLLSELLPVKLEIDTLEEKKVSETTVNNQMIEDLFQVLTIDVSELITILQRAEKKLGYTFSTEAFINLIVHLGIAIKRSQTGNVLELDQELKNKLKTYDEFKIAKYTADEIEEKYKITFQQSETYYILLHFLGAKTIKTDLNLDFKISLEQKEMEEYIIHFIKEVQYDLNLYLENDRQLFNNLILHLKPTINRLRYNLSLQNPLKKEIIQNYNKIYQAVLKNIDILNNGFDIVLPEDEMAYIVLHFAAATERLNKVIRTLIVCSSGIGMSQLIVAKIESMFKNIEVIASISLLEIPKYMNRNIDLIISTIDIGEVEGIKTVFVNPLLNEFDLSNIKNAVNTDYNNVAKKIIFEEDNIYIIKNKLNKVEVLKFLNNELLQKNRVSDHYFSSVLEREKIGSTYIGNGVAVVHGAINEVNISCLQIVQLENKILWDNENEVDFILNFVAKQIDAGLFAALFKKIGTKLDDKVFWNKVTKTKDKKDLCSLLNEELLHDYNRSIN